MSGLRFVQKLASSPWLCDQEHVEFLHGIFLRYVDRAATGQSLDVRALEHELGRPLDNTRNVTVRDGVARIPVDGTIMRRASLFTEMSGGVSAEALMRDFHSVYADPSVRSILFSFDSPGGEAHGIHELAAAIRAKRDLGEKRIEAYCDGLCASAAYWLASATERITADPTAALGSIGIVTQIRNPEAAGKQLYLEFWNSKSPKKRPDPTTESGRKTIQGYVDDMGDEFIAAVADNRGVSVETVARDFGQGFVMTGRRAVEAGLADALGSEEEVMGRLGQETSGRIRVAANTRLEVAAMPETEERQQQGAKPRQAEGAEGILSRIRSMLAMEPDATASEDEPERRNNVRLEERDSASVLVADSGETLELSAEDRDRLASERDAELAEENARLRRELAEANEKAEALSDENKSALAKYREGQVDRELDGFRAEGVPPYLIELARPALLSADGGEVGGQEAERWRQVLAGAKGDIEYGERGVADGKPPSELTDDEKVRAHMEEHGASYEDAATALAARGEIRREQ